MKKWSVALICGAAMVLSLRQGWGRPVDLSAPSGELGAANSRGYLEIWREIDDVGLQLGKGSYLPLRYKFSTDPTTGGILGPGFYMPMFEAKNVLIRESTMRAYLPCGKGLYMWRDNVDPNKFRSVDDQWTGYITGDDYVVWRDDGWKVQYHKSRLASITADDGHVFHWLYDQSGLPESISENGQSIITLEPNLAGQIAAIVFNGKRYELAYAKRPMTEMLMGQVAIKELDQALSNLKYPDGTSDTFKFTLTPDRVPTLDFTAKDGQQTIYSWDTSTAFIASEKSTTDTWTYKIGQVTEDFGNPPISRTSNAGKIEQTNLNKKMGTITSLDSDGHTTITHFFSTPGVLYNKVQRVDRIDGKTETTIYRAVYDERGKQIRAIDENGYIETYNYDEQGHLKNKNKSLPIDPKALAALQSEQDALTKRIAQAPTEVAHEMAARDLGQFYLLNKLDPTTALKIASQLDHKHAFALRIQAIDFNQLLTPAAKIEGYKALLKEYPEYKERLDFEINMRQQEH